MFADVCRYSALPVHLRRDERCRNGDAPLGVVYFQRSQNRVLYREAWSIHKNGNTKTPSRMRG